MALPDNDDAILTRLAALETAVSRKQAIMELVVYLEDRIAAIPGGGELQRMIESVPIIAPTMPTAEPTTLPPSPAEYSEYYTNEEQRWWNRPIMGAVKLVDLLAMHYPGLWQIRGFVDYVTWKKLAIYCLVVIAAANTPLQKEFVKVFPVMQPVLKYVRYDTYLPQHKNETAPNENPNNNPNEAKGMQNAKTQQ